MSFGRVPRTSCMSCEVHQVGQIYLYMAGLQSTASSQALSYLETCDPANSLPWPSPPPLRLQLTCVPFAYLAASRHLVADSRVARVLLVSALNFSLLARPVLSAVSDRRLAQCPDCALPAGTLLKVMLGLLNRPGCRLVALHWYSMMVLKARPFVKSHL
jgi:hypothetical protein